MPETAPTAHHPLGPSNYPAWAVCACFEGVKDLEDADVEALAPESKEKPAADTTAKGRGTAMHEALAKALRGMANAFAGLSEPEELQVRWVAESTVEAAAAAGYSAEEIQVEQRVTMFRGDSFEPLYFGTPDIQYGPFIDDAKYGDPRNYLPQFAGYALAVMERDGYRRMYVRARYGRWKKVTQHVLDRGTAETIVYGILAKRESPHRRPVACEYCGWCKHITYCEAINPNVNAVLVKRDDWAFRLPTMHVSQAGVDPVILGAMRWLWKAYIEPWGKGVEYATNVMADCGNVPFGFKKQDERGRLVIDDGAGALKALLSAGIAREHLEAAFSYSMDGLAIAYRAQFGGSEAGAKRKIEEILVAAKVAKRGDASYKLIRRGDAEDEIRSALARPAQVLPLPEAKQATNPNSAQG